MPCSSVEVHRRFGRTYHTHFQGLRKSKAINEQYASYVCLLLSAVSCVSCYSIMKTEVTCSPVYSVDFKRSTRLHTQEDLTLQSLPCSQKPSTCPYIAQKYASSSPRFSKIGGKCNRVTDIRGTSFAC
jgi:hypothetical protein